MAKNNKKLDFVIVGDSLPAILCAVENSQNGYKGAIMSGAETLGGLYRGMSLQRQEQTSDISQTQLVDTHMNYIPNTEATLHFLERIKKWIPELEWAELELGPLTFQNGTTQPFLGFGARTVDAIDFYSYFTSPQRLKTNLSLAQIVARLIPLFTGDVLINSEVTQLQITDGVGQLQCNGTDLYSADRIFYFESSAKLAKIVPTDSPAFPKSSVQRLSKSQHWAAVNLVYWHKTTVTESAAVHVLYGAKELPCLGVFAPLDNQQSSSQWMSVLSAENFADTEQLGLTIREMKKQIKRMYPLFFEAVEKEFIVIAPDAFSSAPAAVTHNPDLFKNGVVYLGSQHYSTDMALLGEAQSYLLLAPYFLAASTDKTETPTAL